MTALKFLKRIDSIIEWIEGASVIVILTVMIIIAFLQVLLRNYFSTALPWGDGLTRALVLWAGFIGASLAVKQGRYINIDALNRLLNEKQKRLTRIVVYLFSVVVCFFLGKAGYSFTAMEFEGHNISSLGIENGWIVIVIPVTFWFLCFRFLIKTFNLMLGGEMEKHEWEQ